jgi:hypothetical protein
MVIAQILEVGTLANTSPKTPSFIAMEIDDDPSIAIRKMG